MFDLSLFHPHDLIVLLAEIKKVNLGCAIAQGSHITLCFYCCFGYYGIKLLKKNMEKCIQYMYFYCLYIFNIFKNKLLF